MKPYIPDPLPLECLDYGQLIGLVGQANAEIARYDGLLQGIVNPAILLSPLTTQEAVLSSRIEGTQATLDEVLEHDAGFIADGNQDIHEVINYRAALRTATSQLKARNITLGLLKDMHRLLMDSVRGQDKDPGLFRVDQNWIGTQGTPIEEATFVPPNPLQLIDHLEAWERYVQSNDVDFLIQMAVIHAQFELIHPFKDGNGRIGRLLIPLFLYSKGVLSSPMFYLSGYLESHRDQYYEHLRLISSDKDWNSWVVFFLEVVIQQAKDNADKVHRILELYEEMKTVFAQVTRSQYAIQSLDAIFDKPIFKTSDFIERTTINKKTGLAILAQLKEANILDTIREASGRRPAILIFPQLINLAEGKNVA